MGNLYNNIKNKLNSMICGTISAAEKVDADCKIMTITFIFKIFKQ